MTMKCPNFKTSCCRLFSTGSKQILVYEEIIEEQEYDIEHYVIGQISMLTVFVYWCQSETDALHRSFEVKLSGNHMAFCQIKAVQK